MRLGAFIGVMAFCYGIVMAGAWQMSVVTPTLHVGMPAFSVETKVSAARLHAKKTDPCPLSPGGINLADVCDADRHMCGRHDSDSCGATSLYCGCHAHDDKQPGTTASAAPDSLPSSVVRPDVSLARLTVPDEPSSRKFLLAFRIERPPSFLRV